MAGYPSIFNDVIGLVMRGNFIRLLFFELNKNCILQ